MDKNYGQYKLTDLAVIHIKYDTKIDTEVVFNTLLNKCRLVQLHIFIIYWFIFLQGKKFVLIHNSYIILIIHGDCEERIS